MVRMVFLKIPNPGKKKVRPVVNPPLEVELVASSKQKAGVRLQASQEAEFVVASRGVGERNGLPPQVMGGGSVESGGDGTGWAGGITLDYWVKMLKNLANLEEMLGRPPIEGEDYPSQAQMEQARRFYRGRERG